MSNNKISRRDFLERLGLGIGAATGVTALSCNRRTATPASEATATTEGTMTYRTTPSTGDKVSLLGYGCMRWPTMPDPNSTEEGAEIIDQEMVNQLVDAALAAGVNYFDTSPVYCQGHSEEATGIALSRHPRNSYFIATKMSNFSPATHNLANAKQMYYDSMRFLRTDYIDYMLLHSIGGGGMANLHARYLDNGLLDFLLAEREAGRIRNLGFSYHGDIEVFDYLLSQHDRYHWDFVQIQLNYLDWTHAKELNQRNTNAEYLYDELYSRGIPAVIMEPLLGGRLAKQPDHIVNRLKERDPEASVASWAFRFAGSPEGVLTVLSGMTYMEHLLDNIHTFSPLRPLTDDDNRFLQSIADLIMEYPSIPCNECQYCMPCPYGLNIPAIFSHYNRCLNENNVVQSQQDPDYRRARRAFLVGYDRAIPSKRQADHCVGCGKCLSHCPQNIDIPAEMVRINNYVEQLKQDTL